MEALYAINLATAFLLLFWPIWFSRVVLRLPWLNPFTIGSVIGSPVPIMKLVGGPLVLIDGGLFDTGYQMAVLMSNLFTLAQAAGCVVYFLACASFRLDRMLPFQRVVLGPVSLRRGMLFFIGLYMLAFVLLASAEFGIVNWLINPREGYQLYRTGQGHWYALATSSMSVAFVLAVLWRPRPGWVLFSTAICLAMGYLLGSKGTLLAIFTSSAIFLWFLGWRHLTALVFFGAPLMMLLLLVNLYLALADGFGVQAILEYFDYYKNAADYYSAYLRGEVSLFLGEVSLSSLWAYVPRGLYSDKPVVYGALLVNEIFYPGAAEMTNTPAFGGAVEQFADFGVLGVLLFGFFSSQAMLIAMLSYFIFRRPGIRFDRITLTAAVLLIVQYSPAFGAFFPGGLYFVLLLLVVFSIIVVRAPRRRRRTILPETLLP
jgi:hypothetical protein